MGAGAGWRAWAWECPPPPVGVVRLGSVIGAGLMRTTRARRRSCTPCRGPRHSAAPPPCKAAPRPPGTRPSPTPTFLRRRTRPRAKGVSTVSSHTALLPSALESHPISTHVASEHAPCTLGCGVGTVPTSVGVGLGCGVTSSPSLGRGGVARLPAGRPVHACTSAQHRMHAAVEVAASMHKKAVRALLLVARETHPGNKGGTSFAAGRARPQVLAVARGARSAPR